MANIKLKHDLGWIVDHLVSHPGHLHLQFKQKARAKFSDSENGIRLILIFQYVMMGKMMNSSEIQSMGCFKHIKSKHF